MKLERGIPVAYMLSKSNSMMHIREGPSISSHGTLWSRSLSEESLTLCPVSDSGESVEDVVISPATDYVHCKLSERQGQLLWNGVIATYGVRERRVVSRIPESDLVSLRPQFSVAGIYRLIDGSTNDDVLNCVLNFGHKDGLLEAWIAEINIPKRQFRLEAQLPTMFW